MFPIALDGRYLLTLALYSGFIILIELTLLAVSRAGGAADPRLVLRHDPFLAGPGGGGQYLVIRDQLSVAWATYFGLLVHARGYDQWFTLHQVLNRWR